MTNPDFSINPNTTPDQVVPANAPRPMRPTGVPQSKKEFKKVMGKDQNEDDDDDNNLKEVKEGDKVKGHSSKSTKRGDAPDEDKTSIFTLSRSTPKKQVALNEDTPEDTEDPTESVDEVTSKGEKPVTNFHPLLKGKEQVAESPKMAVNLYAPPEKKEPDMSVQFKGKKTPAPSVDQPVAAFVEDDEEGVDNFLDSSKEDAEKVAINPELMVQKPHTQTIIPGYAPEVKGATAPVQEAPRVYFHAESQRANHEILSRAA